MPSADPRFFLFVLSDLFILCGPRVVISLLGLISLLCCLSNPNKFRDMVLAT